MGESYASATASATRTGFRNARAPSVRLAFGNHPALLAVCVLMQLLMMLAVVAAVAISDSAPRQPIADGSLYLMLALACMTAVPLFAVAVARVTVLRIRSGAERQHWLRRFTRLRTAHTILWSASIAAVLYGFGWPQIVRCNWQLEGLFLAEDLLILFPVVIPMTLSWAAFYEVDRELAAAHSGGGQPLESRASYVAMYVRHDLGLLLVPVISLFALQDAIRWIAPQFDQHDYLYCQAFVNVINRYSEKS